MVAGWPYKVCEANLTETYVWLGHWVGLTCVSFWWVGGKCFVTHGRGLDRLVHNWSRMEAARPSVAPQRGVVDRPGRVITDWKHIWAWRQRGGRDTGKDFGCQASTAALWGHGSVCQPAEGRMSHWVRGA